MVDKKTETKAEETKAEETKAEETKLPESVSVPQQESELEVQVGESYNDALKRNMNIENNGKEEIDV